MTNSARFRQRAGWLAEAADWTAGLLAAAIVFDAVAVAFFRRLLGQGGGGFRTTAHAVGVELVNSLAAFCLVAALWRLKAVFARMQAGATLASENVSALGACGSAVIAAAAAQLVVTPTLLGWLEMRHGVKLDFSWEALALGLFGAALALLGEALGEGAAARAELDQII